MVALLASGLASVVYKRPLKKYSLIFSFLGRKAMKNLDSILKSRDVILPTKIHIIKAMVFPVVMSETWTIKKAKH